MVIVAFFKLLDVVDDNELKHQEASWKRCIEKWLEYIWCSTSGTSGSCFWDALGAPRSRPDTNIGSQLAPRSPDTPLLQLLLLFEQTPPWILMLVNVGRDSDV